MIAGGRLLGAYPIKERGTQAYLLYRGRWRRIYVWPNCFIIKVDGHHIEVTLDNFQGE